MRRFLLVLSLAVPVALHACANDDDTPPGPKTAVPPVTTGEAGPPAEAAVDAPGPTVAVRCTQAEFDAPSGAAGGDYTAATTPIAVTFPLDGAAAQYTNRCIKVKVGASVTFTGSFVSHPLEPNGGDVPTPIPAITSTNPAGGTLALTMTKAGTYGYQCQIHPGFMFGAIQVVP